MTTRVLKTCAVMAVHNRRELTLRCLESIAASTRAGDGWQLDVSVVVVDDGSDDGTTDAIAQRFPEVQVVHGDGSLYYAAAMHLGQRAALDAEPDIVVSLNDDTVLDPDALVELVSVLEHRRGTVVGALLVPIDDPDGVMLVAPHWSTAYGGWRHSWGWQRAQLPTEPFRVESIVGNCVAVRATDLRDVGLISPSTDDHFHGDVGWTAAFARAGYDLVVAPRAVVRCEPSTSPTPLSSLGPVGALRALLLDQRHPANLRVAWRGRWRSAPSHRQAVAGFAVHVMRLFQRALGVGAWPHWPDRPPPR